jgi:KDO2-lipid IV(A) lauroyltransferase
MNFLLFCFSFGIIWLLSWLPLRVLYVVSDICFFFIWYIIPYRKKLVFKNLSLSFPEKSAAELKVIARRSYRHSCDNFIEALAAVHMSKKEHFKRYKLNNFEVINNLRSAGKDILLVSAHYGNWEWLSILPLYTDFKILAVYKTLHNAYFDRMFSNLRSKYGAIPVTREKTFRTITEFRNKRIPMIVYLLGDQRPMWKEIQHWTRFMNQDTSVILGPEKIARKMDMAVVFIKHQKIRRGFYESDFITITSNPAETKPLEIAEKYYQILESIIRESPVEYLWTHNRWKHTWKKDRFKKRHDSQPIS